MATQYTILSSTTDGPEEHDQDIVTEAPIKVRDITWGNPILHGHCKLSGLIGGTLNKGPTSGFGRMEPQNCWPLFSQRAVMMLGSFVAWTSTITTE